MILNKQPVSINALQPSPSSLASQSTLFSMSDCLIGRYERPDCWPTGDNQAILNDAASSSQEPEPTDQEEAEEDEQESTNEQEEEEEEEEEDNYYENIDNYLSDNLSLSNKNISLNRANSNVDSAYSNSSSPNSTSSSSSSFKLNSGDSFLLTNFSFASNLKRKYASGKIRFGYSGRAKNQTVGSTTKPADDNKIDEDYFNVKLNYGDDCSFLLNLNKQKYFFGIADGVSANRLRGYDARLFPDALLNECASCIIRDDYKNKNKKQEEEEDSLFEEEEESEEENNSPCLFNAKDTTDCNYLFKILLDSHNKVQEQRVYGSSTVCLLSLRFNNNNDYYDEYDDGKLSNPMLSTCNLGDSGYMIIRNKNVLFKSQSQSHRYNAPYQLGCTPPELLEHDLYRDKPNDSICLTHEIEPGDFIVVSTDGLFDNLYEDEIALIVHDHIYRTMIEQQEEEEEKKKQKSNEKLLLEESDQNDEKVLNTVINSNDPATAESISSNFQVTNDLLETACDLLLEKASKAGIKRDDMLIMLIYVD